MSKIMPDLHRTQSDCKYSALSIWGYVDDRTLEGFKTPVFKNGGAYQLQVVDERDQVIEFEEYDDTVDRKVIRPNGYLSDQVSIVNKPAIYAFKPFLDDLIVGKRRSLKPKLRQWLRSKDEDEISESTILDILLFVEADERAINNAIENLIRSLNFKTERMRERYRTRLLELSHQARPESTNSYGASIDNSAEIDIETLSSRLARAIDVATAEDRVRLEEAESRFVSWSETTDGDPEHASGEQIRKLVELMVQIEDESPAMRAARDLYRFTYFLNIVNRLIDHNRHVAQRTYSSRISGLVDLDYAFPPSVFSDISSAPSSDFLNACVRGISQLPLARVDRRWVPPGTIVAGRVCDRNEDNLSVEANSLIFEITNTLVSVKLYHSRPFIGDCVLFVTLRGNKATTRGPQYIQQILDLFYPFDRNESESAPSITNGASNSWSIVKLPDKEKSIILKRDALFLKQITEIMGLRRITVVRKKGDGQEDQLSEFKDIINSSWRDLRITTFSKNNIELECAVEDSRLIDPRKLRTFFSMLKKLYPAAKTVIKFKDKNQTTEIDERALLSER